jgi:hypothetical protein
MSQHIIFVTCTYKRPHRIALLRRHIDHIFSKINNYTWIVVEDGFELDKEVSILLSGLNSVYLCIGPSRDKGNIQRNLAFETIRDQRLEGIVYNMDDDNLVYGALCKELRKIDRFAVFPVGNLGPVGIERPIIFEGSFRGWSAGWIERDFPVDMGGFAFPSRVLFDCSSPIWTNMAIGGESEFIARYVNSVNDLDFSACHFNMVCLVFHNEPLDSPIRLDLQ